jgi:hypothetical protein
MNVTTMKAKDSDTLSLSLFWYLTHEGLVAGRVILAPAVVFEFFRLGVLGFVFAPAAHVYPRSLVVCYPSS